MTKRIGSGTERNATGGSPLPFEETGLFAKRGPAWHVGPALELQFILPWPCSSPRHPLRPNRLTAQWVRNREPRSGSASASCRGSSFARSPSRSRLEKSISGLSASPPTPRRFATPLYHSRARHLPGPGPGVSWFSSFRIDCLAGRCTWSNPGRGWARRLYR